MKRQLAGSALALLVAVALSCALMAVVTGGWSWQATWETVQAAVPVGIAWLAVTHLALRARSAGSLRTQYALATAGTAAIALAGVLWMAHEMFVSSHDVGMLLAFVGFGAVVGVRTASLLAARTSGDVERLREGLDAIASGDLARRVEPSGPAELRSLARSANAMAESLERARDEVEAADAARRSLVAAVSHDLRTPLASLRLLADAIHDGVISDPAEVETAARRISAHVTALSALVDDLFELARLDAGDITWSLSRLAVGELLDETVEAFRPQAEQKRLHLAGSVEAQLAPITGNPEKLQRVLYNLVQNAVRHTPVDGTVTLHAEPDGGFVRIEVADSGDGVEPEDAERAFERFWRGGSAAARPAGGAGLGLTICRAIVEAHGGRIWIEPAAPQGTRVCFTVPAAR
jgi:signal transduction histidine kinase